MYHEIMRLERVDLTINNVDILKNAWLDIRRGEILGVVGLRYAGKTSLANIMCGHMQASNARIYFDETLQEHWDERLAIRKGIFNISNFRHICPNMTVMENVFLTQRLGRSHIFPNRQDMEIACAELFEKLKIHLSPNESLEGLGFFERMEVSLAKAVAHGGRIVILDEVLPRLSDFHLQHFFDEISAASAMGAAVVLFDNDFKSVAHLAKRMFIIRHGCVAGILDRDQFDFGKMQALIAGVEKKPSFVSHRQVRSNVLFEICRKNAGAMSRFAVADGSITGLVIPQNASMAQLLSAIQGKKTTQFSTRLNGKRLTRRTAMEKIGIVHDENSFFATLSFWDNLTLIPNRSNLILNLFLNHYGEYAHCNAIVKEYFNEEFLHMYRDGVNNLDHFDIKIITMVRLLNRCPTVMVYVNPEHRLTNADGNNSILPKIDAVRDLCRSTLILSYSLEVCKYICDVTYIMDEKGDFLQYPQSHQSTQG